MMMSSPPEPLLPDFSRPLHGDFAGPRIAPSAYVIEIDAAVRRELDRATRHLARDANDRSVVTDVRAATANVTERTRAHLSRGIGVALVRGVPTDGHGRDALARLFTLLGEGLGSPAPQNLDGDLVTDVRDTGADPNDPDVRLYRTRAEQDFHTDGADVIGLLCLHTAAVGGLSRLVSSVRVLREVAAARPDLFARLFEPWYFHLPGGTERGLPGAFPRPIATYDGERLETFYIGWYLRRAAEVAGVPELEPEQHELLELFERTANDPRLFLDMDLRPGDIQWLRNAFVLHKRTAYEDAAPPAPKRHLLRLWLSASYLDDGTPRFPDAGVGR